LCCFLAIIDLFYNGFCNNILWPLIHYIPPPIEIDANDTYAEQYNAYYRANLSFVEAILQVYDNKWVLIKFFFFN
jgi:trehalose 6-phosphate synthase/phosphatase